MTILPFSGGHIGVESFFSRIMSYTPTPTSKGCHFHKNCIYNMNEQVFDKNLVWRFINQRLAMGI